MQVCLNEDKTYFREIKYMIYMNSNSFITILLYLLLEYLKGLNNIVLQFD